MTIYHQLDSQESKNVAVDANCRVDLNQASLNSSSKEEEDLENLLLRIALKERDFFFPLFAKAKELSLWEAEEKGGKKHPLPFLQRTEMLNLRHGK